MTISSRSSLKKSSEKKDTTTKRAQYIERNCEINQETNMAHPEVKSRTLKKFEVDGMNSKKYPIFSTVLFDVVSILRACIIRF